MLLVFLGFFGIYKAFKKYTEKIKEIVLLLMPMVLILIVHILLCAIPRYQVPVMPFMIIFASFGILYFVDKVNNKRHNHQ
jgi:hypothetical protein